MSRPAGSEGETPVVPIRHPIISDAPTPTLRSPSTGASLPDMSDTRNTPLNYDRDELDQIRNMMARGAPVVCPICGGVLDVGGVVAGGGSVESVWAWSCEACNRTAILRDITKEP